MLLEVKKLFVSDYFNISLILTVVYLEAKILEHIEKKQFIFYFN